jgi:N-acyl-D-amino-acid deacylase
MWEEVALQQEDMTIDVKTDPAAEKKGSILTKVIPTGQNVRRVAFLYDKTPATSGWTLGHEIGRQHVQRVFDGQIEAVAYENIMEGDGPEAAMERAVADGMLLGCDRYPFCAAGTDLDIVFPDWAGQGGAHEEMKRLRDPELRRRIENELAASGRDWSTVMIGGVWHPENKSFCGRFVSELTDDPARFICEVLERDECRTGAFFFGMSEENLTRILSKSWTLPGSDASLRSPSGPLGADHPHPRAYATMPEFYRRLLPLVGRSAAIARMTSLPARRFGLKGRGVIEKGAFADLAVWCEEEFCGQSTYAEPHRFSCGMKAVMVNGAIPYLNGSFTGRLAGRFLERG